MSKTLAEMIAGGKVRVKLHGAVWELALEKGTDPKEFVDRAKEADPTAEFDSKLYRDFGGKGGFGGGRDTKRAAILVVMLNKMGADISAQTPEGEDITVRVWKDKIAELFGSLPLSDKEKEKIARAADGTSRGETISLVGKGFECSYYEREKDGQKTYNATELHAPAAGNGAKA